MNDQRQQRPGYSQRPQQQTRTQEQSRPRQEIPPTAGAGNQAPAIAKPIGKQRLFERFGEKFGVDPDLLVETLKATCFRGQRADSPPITNEQLVALLIVADQYGLNPFTKEIYAYPDKNGGIVAVVSIDGWLRIINEHPQFNGMEIRTPDALITDESNRKYKHKPCWEWMEVTIFRKDREHNQPLVEFFDEVYRQSLNLKNGTEWYEVTTPWQSHTKRMMRHKTIIQAGRVTFGFAGIYDDDEAERILNDGSVVMTVPPNQSRTDVAKEALRARQGGAAQNPPAQAAQQGKEAAAQAASASAQPATVSQAAGQKAAEPDTDSIPWEDETAKKLPENPRTPNEWGAEMKAAKTLDELHAIWDRCLGVHDAAGAEVHLDIEAIYQLLRDRFNGK